MTADRSGWGGEIGVESGPNVHICTGKSLKLHRFCVLCRQKCGNTLEIGDGGGLKLDFRGFWGILVKKSASNEAVRDFPQAKCSV
jgi:hypothetical protein